jgi:hypothetical protein
VKKGSWRGFISVVVLSASLSFGHLLFRERLSHVKTAYEQWLSSVESAVWNGEEGFEELSIVVRLREDGRVQQWTVVVEEAKGTLRERQQILKFLQLIREGELVERHEEGNHTLEVEIVAEASTQDGTAPYFTAAGQIGWKELRNNWPAQNLITLLETGSLGIEKTNYVEKREAVSSDENKG